MTRRSSIPLDDGWEVTASGPAVPEELAGVAVAARAPMSGHSALIAAGLMPDPYVGDEESRARWANRASWRFSRDLPAITLAPDERVDLVLDGVDTFARIEVGNELLATTANMHRAVRLPLGSHLSRGGALSIAIEPALEVAESELGRVGPRPAAYPHPYYLVRKMAASFGWDWGPDLQAAGLWRPARLERWAIARIAVLQPTVRRVDGNRWVVDVRIEVERATDSDLEVVVTLDGAAVHAEVETNLGDHGAVVTLSVEDPQLWWPHDRGSQPLARLTVRLRAGGEIVDEVVQRLGFRDIEARQLPDEQGTSFVLAINGEALFVRGVNWIPDDHLVDRVSREQLRERLGQARDANANLVRVWGGGTYESDDFYELCDELGLLVWQDVAMACAGYPESEPLRSELLAEVRENAVRLAPHPSLVLWCGGNENAWGYPQWEERGDITVDVDWGARYIYEWLPELLAAVDPTRPYISNSPFSLPNEHGVERWPNDPAHGISHEWDVWNRDDYTRYRDVVPRFCAEFGYQAPPAWSIVARALAAPGEQPDRQTPAFLAHQKAEDGMGKLERGMAPHLGHFADLENWHAATQAMQAIAIRTAVEHFRSNWPTTAGAIVWQLNDCWPSVSWSMVDSDGRPKPAWFALRRAFANRLITAAPAGEGWRVSLINDSDEPWETPVRIRRETLDGVLRAEATVDAEVARRAVEHLEVPGRLLEEADPRREILVVTAGELEVPVLLAEPIDVMWSPDAFTVETVPDSVGWRMRVRARSAVFGLTLSPDRLDPDARVDDGMLDLAAGATAEFLVSIGRRNLDAEALIVPPVLSWLGELAAVSSRSNQNAIDISS